MANAIITIKVMPESPEVDMEALQKIVLEKVTVFNENKETKTEIEPVAFGLKALKVTFVCDEAKGSPEPLEKEISALDEVNSCETIDVRRAIG